MKGTSQEWERHGCKLLKRFWGRCISEVWEFFRFEVNEEGMYVNRKCCICLICGMKMKYCGNTTNLSNHLDRKHAGWRHVKKSDQDNSTSDGIFKDEDGKNILRNLVEAYTENEMTCSVQVGGASEVDDCETKPEPDDTTVKIFKSFWGDNSDSVWDFFKFEVGETGQYVDMNTVHCTLCDMQLAYMDDTADLVIHLDSVHPGTRTVQVKQEKEEIAVPSTSEEEEIVKRFVEQCSREIEKSGGKSEVTTTLDFETKHGKYFKSFWGNATSTVWKYFKFETDKDGNYKDKNILYCMLCDTKLKYCHNTTNMAHHLERRHNISKVAPYRKYPGIEQCRNLIEKLPTTPTPRPKKLYTKIPTTARIPSVFMKSFTQKRFQEEGDIVIDDSTQYRSFWGHALSPVWKHFKFEVDARGNYVDKMAAYCTLCGLRMRYIQSTSNLAQHLRRKHFEEYFASDGQAENIPEERVTAPAPAPAPPKPIKPKCEKDKSTRISAAIAKYLIKEVRPISDVELVSFHAMCEAMCPEYTVPDKNKFKENILVPLYNEKKAKMLTEMSSAIRHCVTVDWWKSSKLNFVTVMVHYLSDLWDLHSQTLLTFKIRERPTPQELATRLSHMAKQWNLKSPVILRDSSYVMKAAATSVLQWPNVPGLDHTVDMAVFKVLSLPSVHQFLSQIRNLFSQLKQVAHCAQIKQKQDMMYLPEKDLLRDFGDHWSSTLEMVVLFVEQEQVFQSVVIDCKLDEALLLSDSSLAKTRDLIQILQVLKTATAYLTPERRHTLSVIMPITIKLKECLRRNSHDNEFVLLVKHTMLEVIEESYSGESTQILMKTASALDPRMKKLAFLTESERDEIHQKLCREAVAFAKDTMGVEKDDADEFTLVISDEDEPKAKIARTDNHDNVSISDWLGDIVSVKGSSLTIAQQVDNELKLFITEQDITFDDSPLQWWKRRWQMYTLLSPVAKKYMCIPAIGAEMTNSNIRNKRIYLEPDTADMQLFLSLDNHDNKTFA